MIILSDGRRKYAMGPLVVVVIVVVSAKELVFTGWGISPTPILQPGGPGTGFRLVHHRRPGLVKPF